MKPTRDGSVVVGDEQENVPAKKKRRGKVFDVCVPVDPNFGAIVGRNGTFTIRGIRVWGGRDGCFYIDGLGKRHRTINGGLSCDGRAMKEIGEAVVAHFASEKKEPDGCPYCGAPWAVHDGDGSCEMQQRALKFHCPSCDADLQETGVIVISPCEREASVYVEKDGLHLTDYESPTVLSEITSICCHECGEALPEIMRKAIAAD